MKVVFVSNYFSHHQEPFSLAMDKLTEHQYTFIATSVVSKERVRFGYSDLNGKYPWILRAYESSEAASLAKRLIDEADVLIWGSAPQEMIRSRLENKQLTFAYSERIYKQKPQWYKTPVRIIKHWARYSRYKNFYLLCASAYTAADYAKTLCFLNKTYKWGYFPKTVEIEDIGQVIAAKKKNSILWAGRLIDWKYPERALQVVKRLKEWGYDIQLNLIGEGPLKAELQDRIKQEELEDCVSLLGSMTPDAVRAHMEKSEIFLFTSDRNEGWGAVLNESMNSACAVVASHAIGSVPFLIKDKENGLIYRNGDIEDLCNKVKWLLDYPKERVEISKKAYKTLVNEWNAENAAKRFLGLAQEILDGNKHAYPYKDGVCSKAEKLKDDWY